MYVMCNMVLKMKTSYEPSMNAMANDVSKIANVLP